MSDILSDDELDELYDLTVDWRDEDTPPSDDEEPSTPAEG